MSRASRQHNTLENWLHVDVGGGDLPLHDVHVDSRNIVPGDVFIAIAGERADGRDFASTAVANGAAAILVESGGLTPALTQLPVPVVEIPDLGRRAARMAADFYHLDDCQISAIGVTGTNGKTTVTGMLAHMLCALGRPCALVGTLGWGFAGHLQGSGMTTPDAVSMARILRALDRQGARHVAIEVSSHGLSQGRVDEAPFAAAVFTNLSQDHLDYHDTMEAYAAAKRRLFLACDGLQVINIDDQYGRELFADHRIKGEPKLAYSLSSPRAHVYCRSVEYSVAGSSAEVVTPWGETTLWCPLPGDFNLLNALACITLLGAWGFPPERVAPLLAAVRGAPGRMEVVHSGGATVIVDYAHTPDALDKVLGSLRPHVRRQLSVVIGCGGNRDRGKRPLIAASATTLADVAIFTSDNPRNEAPEAILQDMTRELDAERRARVTIEVDRRAAISLALSRAQEGDVVVIAGKGHEDYQEVCGQRLFFSDSACVREFYQEAG